MDKWFQSKRKFIASMIVFDKSLIFLSVFLLSAKCLSLVRTHCTGLLKTNHPELYEMPEGYIKQKMILKMVNLPAVLSF